MVVELEYQRVFLELTKASQAARQPSPPVLG